MFVLGFGWCGMARGWMIRRLVGAHMVGRRIMEFGGA